MRFPELVRRRTFASYLLIAFAFTWILLPSAANSLLVSLVALWGPAIAALVVTAACDPAERHDFRFRLTHWRLPFRWYLLAFAIPPLVTLIRSGLEYIWSGERIEAMPLTAIGAVVFVLVVGEEIGWRGFALPRLLPRLGPRWSSVVLGLVWGLWHLPLLFMPGMPQFEMPITAFLIYTISLSVVLTYLAQHTRGSVLIATCFHGAVNTLGWVVPTADAPLRGWSNAICYGVLAAVIGSLAWGRRPATLGPAAQ